MIRKFKGIFQSPGARITDQLCRSESRQAGFSCGFCYPLVNTVLNVAQIANKIAAHFKTEFFNRIGRKRTLKSTILRGSERPLSGKADIRRGRRRGQIGWTELPQANARRKCRNSTNHAPATKMKKGRLSKRVGLFILGRWQKFWTCAEGGSCQGRHRRVQFAS